MVNVEAHRVVHVIQLVAMTLAAYQDKFRRLNVNVRAGRASPHKICMLLALLDLARSGGLTDNRVEFSPPLLERYQRFFAAVRTPSDHSNPYFPFFHLAGKLLGGEAGFWHLQPLPGRETALAVLSTARSLRDITDNIACANAGSGTVRTAAATRIARSAGRHTIDPLAGPWPARPARGRDQGRRGQPLRASTATRCHVDCNRGATARLCARPSLPPRGD